jgi:hypothetical protein
VLWSIILYCLNLNKILSNELDIFTQGFIWLK